MQDTKTKILVTLKSMRIPSPHRIQDFSSRICAFILLIFSHLSCPRVLGPLALNLLHLLLPFCIYHPFFLSFPSTRTNRSWNIYPKTSQRRTRASAPEMTSKAEKQTTSCQRPAPQWQPGLYLLSGWQTSCSTSHHATALHQHQLLVGIGWRYHSFPSQKRKEHGCTHPDIHKALDNPNEGMLQPWLL